MLPGSRERCNQLTLPHGRPLLGGWRICDISIIIITLVMFVSVILSWSPQTSTSSPQINDHNIRLTSIRPHNPPHSSSRPHQYPVASSLQPRRAWEACNAGYNMFLVVIMWPRVGTILRKRGSDVWALAPKDELTCKELCVWKFPPKTPESNPCNLIIMPFGWSPCAYGINAEHYV